MTLTDFENGLVPGLHIKGYRNNASQRFQIEQWIRDGLLVCHGNPKPDAVMDQLFYAKPGIDKTRWPYICGAMARKQGKTRDSSKLSESACGTLRCWLAGWDEAA